MAFADVLNRSQGKLGITRRVADDPTRSLTQRSRFSATIFNSSS